MEARTGTPDTEAAQRLCQVGAGMSEPCQREATEKAWDENEVSRCPEHQKAYDLARRLDGFFYAVSVVNGYVESEEVRDDAYGVLNQAVYEMRDGIVDEAAKAAQELKVADLIANAPPPAGAERGSSTHRYTAHLMSRADSFALARAILLDEAGTPSGEDRLVVLDAINAAHEEANAEASAYREERS